MALIAMKKIQYSIHKGAIFSSKKNSCNSKQPILYSHKSLTKYRGHFQRQNKSIKSIWRQNLCSLIRHWCWLRPIWLFQIPMVVRSLIACVIWAIRFSRPLCIQSMQQSKGLMHVLQWPAEVKFRYSCFKFATLITSYMFNSWSSFDLLILERHVYSVIIGLIQGRRIRGDARDMSIPISSHYQTVPSNILIK